ncbi:MAG: hypothetical protein H5U08_00650 [Thermogutta sp.]|uniref:phage major capsid protein n=1 Tax=Thermogutta sp. TaxID=1962930 RepID=UPI001984E157|nr:hypothetical protein [Thermogutta sp.]MBC7350844.1 hypothetical protein [Thermogutta sp.]
MIKAREIYKHFKSDPRQCFEDIQEALRRGLEGKPGGLKPDEFSIRDLAAYFVMVDGEPLGHDMVEVWASGRLVESDVVSSSAFAAITQRVVYAAVLEGYQLPDTPLSRLVRVVQARSRDNRIPSFTLPLADGKSLEYEEGVDKPAVGMATEYAKSLPIKKRGACINITRETVLFDETGQVLDAARRVGEMIALEKERVLTQFVAGLVSNCVIEKRKTDSSEATSNLFLTTGRWVNQQANPLADWTDIDDAENLFLSNTLPGTNLPPMLSSRFILVPPQLRTTANRILNATEVRTGTSNVVASANPLANMGIQPVVSTLLYSEQVAAGVSQATAAGTWFYGDLLQAFRYVQAWPLEVTETRDSASQRRADILVQFDASESGIPMVVEPRVWAKNTPS